MSSSLCTDAPSPQASEQLLHDPAPTKRQPGMETSQIFFFFGGEGMFVQRLVEFKPIRGTYIQKN